MRISDWSSDVCSSDLDVARHLVPAEDVDPGIGPAIAVDQAALQGGVDVAGRDRRGRAAERLDHRQIDRRPAKAQTGEVGLVELVLQVEPELVDTKSVG